MKKTIYLFLCAICAIALSGTKANAQTITGNYVWHACDTETFFIYLSATGPTLTVQTFFGDGTSAIIPADTGTGCYVRHGYASSGSYTVKHILLNSGVPIDSLIFTEVANVCHFIPVTGYLDVNGDCVYDAGDDPLYNPYTLEVDSSGVPVDTITYTSFYYIISGSAPLGTIYAFKVLTPPTGLTATCPSTGIVYDTVGTSTGGRSIGFSCTSSTSFDLTEYVNVYGPCLHWATADVLVTNNYCLAQPGTLTMTFSPKYNFFYAVPTPASVIGNVLTWNFPSLSSVAPQYVSAVFNAPGVGLTAGDTVMSSYVVTPIVGDLVPSNNSISRIDTVTASYDPNEKSVSPIGVVASGTTLHYTIAFENTGNAPAKNIHVQDTLSANVDVKTFKLISSSAPVYTTIGQDGLGHSVLKFDFQNINLLDSSHHGLCDGLVTFTVNAKTGLANGTVIDNTAGIYFDDNTVVMTNTVENTIGLPPSLSVMTTNTAKLDIYPNPVNDELTIKTGNASYNSITVVNTIGQVVITQQMNAASTKVNVKSLPAGVYYITLRGDSGVRVQKFEKL